MYRHEELSWASARSFCENFQSELPFFQKDFDVKLYRSFAGSSVSSGWIGLQRGPTGGWENEDGLPLSSYQYLPTDQSSTGCAYFNLTSMTTEVNSDCTQSDRVFCQRKNSKMTPLNATQCHPMPPKIAKNTV